MIAVSEVTNRAPSAYKTPLQAKVYETLKKLNIPFERVDNDEAITMEDCLAINEKLDVQVVKTLFLCNRQKTSFYLFITCGDKPFVTRDFSTALGISRVSFASPELLDSMLGTAVGATTVLSSVLDTENRVQVIFDKAVLAEEFYGCSDGTTTSYMKLKTEDVFHKYLLSTKHIPAVIEV